MTPILLSVSFVAGAPPLIVSVSPNCFLKTAPLSPPKFNPFSIVELIEEIALLFVAISCLFVATSCLFLLISAAFLAILALFVLTCVLTVCN